MRNEEKALETDATLQPMGHALGAAIRVTGECARLLLHHAAKDQNFAGAVAFNFLMLVGIVTGGWQMARAALVATRKLKAREGDAPFLRAKLATAHFYADHILPRAHAHASAIQAGSASIMELDEEQF
jgi:hypothetical protein